MAILNIGIGGVDNDPIELHHTAKIHLFWSVFMPFVVLMPAFSPLK